MAQTKTIAEKLRAEIATQSRTLPAFLAPRLGPLLSLVDAWVETVEARIAKVEKMPSPQALAMLTRGCCDE